MFLWSGVVLFIATALVRAGRRQAFVPAEIGLGSAEPASRKTVLQGPHSKFAAMIRRDVEFARRKFTAIDRFLDENFKPYPRMD